MGRQKTYDRDKAVTAAMAAFWKGGFSNVGVRQIEDEASINRFALQTDFAGKTGLFLEALEKYIAMSHETTLKPLHRGDLAGIIEFFDQGPAQGEDDLRCLGCLMVNTVIENAELEMDEVRALANAHYQNMEALFETALRTARSQGELPTDFNTADAARGLLTFAMGLEVFIRMNSDAQTVRRQVDFIISEINSWRVTT